MKGTVAACLRNILCAIPYQKREIKIDQTKNWIEISLPITCETEDAIANFLFELGAQGCYTQENILRAYFRYSAWDEDKRDQFQLYLCQLAELHFPIAQDKIDIQKIENRDWNTQWKQSIKPVEIGGQIIVKPGWIHIEPYPTKIIIEIDPQMAFGTGAHETTQLMLELLIEHLGNPSRVMDGGTGTGILAIAAARLSNAQVIAFDNDPIAIITAQQNCIKNGISDRIQLFCGTIDAVKDISFDVILANLNRSIIIESLSKIFRCLNHRGIAIFSGILIDEKKHFVEDLTKYKFKIIKEMQQGEWLGLVVSTY